MTIGFSSGLFSSSALAQWTSQTIPLTPGWNAVFLEIQPEPRDCNTIFGGLPIDSVWSWNRRFSSVEYIQDPSTLVPGQPDWLVYIPPERLADTATANLFALEGGRPYLIRVRNDANPFNWTVQGQPLVKKIDWLADSLNFIGLYVDPVSPPTFQSYFAASSAHAGKPVYRLNKVSGQWVLVSNPATTTIARGEAYWVRCEGQSNFQGPIEVLLEQGNGINYGRILPEQTLRIKNNSLSTKNIRIKRLSSLQPADPSFPALAGEIPLSYFQMNFGASELSDLAEWIPFNGMLEKENISTSRECVVRLEVRRSDMADFIGSVGEAGAVYQSILEVTDGSGSRILIPVTADGLTALLPSPSLPAGVLAATGSSHERAGLWVGTAVINKVSQPSSTSDPTTPTPTASVFQYRLIMHVDDSGKPRLLQKVIQMWKEGTLKPDPNDPTKKVVNQPGRVVLVTNDSLIPSFTGAALRDGEPVGRRISSAVFGFKEPIECGGEFGVGTTDCDFLMDFNDPLNPFKHRYHPDHNNLDERYEKIVEEAFSVSRKIELEFAQVDPEGLALAGWGDNQLGGVYRETISGVHKDDIHVEGFFRLHLAARIGVLNDGL